MLNVCLFISLSVVKVWVCDLTTLDDDDDDDAHSIIMTSLRFERKLSV